MNMELLAPAGNGAALRAAVQSGADAVYIGGSEFGARHSAENFSSEEMKKWIDYCHLYGVDVHVTVNTLIKEKELQALQKYVKELNFAGADALIVQDIGAAEIIKNTVPDMTLHASTQMTVTSAEGVKYLEEMGFSRVVLARELSEKEIEYICKNTNAEIEVFVHGAICMCYSGQCLMSSILGGRSGNRGRCAQPCRLPYELIENGKKAESGYLLSPKDMALVNELETLKKIGVSSLKIEGRLKRPEYVSAVVGVYRKYLDNGGEASKDDMRSLTDAFSRSGFTDGYFKNKLGKRMMSYASAGNSAENKFTAAAKERASESANFRKIPVNIEATLKKGEPLELTFYDGDGNRVAAAGQTAAEEAVNRPLDKKRLEEQLLKLGQTPFICEKTEVYADSGVTLPVKEINAVRRAAAEKMIIERQRRDTRVVTDFTVPALSEKDGAEIVLTAEVSDVNQLKAALDGGIKTIYAPLKVIETVSGVDGINLIAKASEIFSHENIKTDGVLVSSTAAAYKYKNKKLYGDFRLNVFNSMTANHFSDFETVTLSPELNLHEIRAAAENALPKLEVIGYGRIPLMIMKNCPIKALGKCRRDGRVYTLRDRKHEEFPVMCGENCIAKLLNSKPVFTADKICDLKKLKINSIRLIFTVENFSQCGKIIDVYKKALSGKKIDNYLADNSYTRGHFYRGVL